MSVIFSRRCEYALQAVLTLALKPAGILTPANELTKTLGIPYHFLAKILQDLAHKDLLVSQRGPKGGFALALSPSKITLFQVVEAVDGLGFMDTCVMGAPGCSGLHPCAIHPQWGTWSKGFQRMLNEQSVEDLARKTNNAQRADFL